MAVVLLTPCATRLQADRGATLVSALNASVWDQGILTRIVLFRDWLWRGSEAFSVRLAAVQKLNGKSVNTLENAVLFDIDSVRVPLSPRGSRRELEVATNTTQKRKG